MRDYVNQMNNDFPGELYENYTAMKPANENLLKIYIYIYMLSKDKVDMFHTTNKKSMNYAKFQDQTFNLQFKSCAEELRIQI